MADDTITSVQQAAPGVEAAKLKLIKDVEEFIRGRIESGVLPPGYQVADLSGAQLVAAGLAEEGVGAYEPFIRSGSEAVSAGMGAITGAGMGAYESASELTDPSAISDFFNPYEDQVVDQTLADLGRASAIEGVEGRARAAGPGPLAAPVWGFKKQSGRADFLMLLLERRAHLGSRAMLKRHSWPKSGQDFKGKLGRASVLWPKR